MRKDEDGERNPSSDERPTHCSGEPSPAGAKSPSEGAPSVFAQVKQQVNFKAVVLEEKITQIKAKMQQQEATLENQQLP